MAFGLASFFYVGGETLGWKMLLYAWEGCKTAKFNLEWGWECNGLFFAQWTERSEWEFHAISFLLKDILCYAAIAALRVVQSTVHLFWFGLWCDIFLVLVGMSHQGEKARVPKRSPLNVIIQESKSVICLPHMDTYLCRQAGMRTLLFIVTYF